MPRSPKDNREIREARCEEILQAAAKVFAERGFARTKISDIASAAGISYGLLYHYYGSKAAVFEALVERLISNIEQDFEAGGGTPYERLEASLRRVYERLGSDADQRLLSQAMMQGSLPPSVARRLTDHIASLYTRMVERVAGCQAEGRLNPDVPAEELASCLIFLIRGMSIRLPGMPEPSLTPPSLETILRLFSPPTLATSTDSPED